MLVLAGGSGVGYLGGIYVKNKSGTFHFTLAMSLAQSVGHEEVCEVRRKKKKVKYLSITFYSMLRDSDLKNTTEIKEMVSDFSKTPVHLFFPNFLNEKNPNVYLFQFSKP